MPGKHNVINVKEAPSKTFDDFLIKKLALNSTNDDLQKYIIDDIVRYMFWKDNNGQSKGYFNTLRAEYPNNSPQDNVMIHKVIGWVSYIGEICNNNNITTKEGLIDKLKQKYPLCYAKHDIFRPIGLFVEDDTIPHDDLQHLLINAKDSRNITGSIIQMMFICATDIVNEIIAYDSKKILNSNTDNNKDFIKNMMENAIDYYKKECPNDTSYQPSIPNTLEDLCNNINILNQRILDNTTKQADQKSKPNLNNSKTSFSEHSSKDDIIKTLKNMLKHEPHKIKDKIFRDKATGTKYIAKRTEEEAGCLPLFLVNILRKKETCTLYELDDTLETAADKKEDVVARKWFPDIRTNNKTYSTTQTNLLDQQNRLSKQPSR